MALNEEESKKARIFQREKRQELQLIIERCNKIPFDYVCKPLERNVNIVFGTSIPRKIHLFASDKSVNSYARRNFKEHFPEPRHAMEMKRQEQEVNADEQNPSYPFSSKVPRFQESSEDTAQGYRRRKKIQEIAQSNSVSFSAFGTCNRRNLMITRDFTDFNLPGPGTTIPFSVTKKQIVHHSFGGSGITHQPAYEIVCTPKNLDSKCSLCEGEVKNVYWKNPKTQIVYCRACYNQRVLDIKNKSRGALERFRKLNVMENDFRKMRHCEFMHEHNNTRAKILLLTPKEIQKRFRRENYLSAYLKQ